MRGTFAGFSAQTQLLVILMRLKNERLKVLYENFLRYTEDHLDSDKIRMHEEIDRDYLPSDYDQEVIDILHEDVEDWEFFSRDSEEILTHAMVIGLYSNYEKTLKAILRKSNLFTDAEINECSRKPRIIYHLNTKGIQYDKITDSDYLKVDELREINNCLKHSGEISADLHQLNNTFIQGNTLGNLFAEFIRLYDAPYNYLKKIAAELKPLVP